SGDHHQHLSADLNSPENWRNLAPGRQIIIGRAPVRASLATFVCWSGGRAAGGADGAPTRCGWLRPTRRCRRPCRGSARARRAPTASTCSERRGEALTGPRLDLTLTTLRCSAPTSSRLFLAHDVCTGDGVFHRVEGEFERHYD